MNVDFPEPVTPTTPIEEGLKDTLKFNFPDIHK